MRAEVEHHLLLAAAEHHRVRERRHARADLDGPAARVVHHAVQEAPARRVPGPACDRAVHERGPQERPDHGGHEPASLGHGPDGDGAGDHAELHLGESADWQLAQAVEMLTW